MKTCDCGCTVVAEETALGTKVCTGCGTVLEENAVVSELAFKETSGGGCSMVGQFVSDNGMNRYLLPSLKLGGTCESRDVTIQKARAQILIIASQLNLNQHSVDMATRFYKLALQRRLTTGRPLRMVTAALLYITCRLQSAPYMLIDFSDVIEVNLYDLGRMFIFMTETFCLTLPPTDPSMYVLRFAQKLKFGDMERKVATLALRVIKKMQHDWIAIGRRPAGVCGAALLLSARYHGFERTVIDVIRVVHVCSSVVKKRLLEFAVTPSAQLTLEEFPLIDIEESCDPPCFRRDPKMDEETWTEEDVARLSEDMIATEQEVSTALEQHPPGRRGRPPKRVCKSGEGTSSVVEPLPRENPNDLYKPSLAPTPEFLGLRKRSKRARASEKTKEPKRDDENLSDIDDAEIDHYILNPSEVEVKTKIWTAINGEYFEVAEKRREEREAKEEQVKRRPRRKHYQHGEAASANEAMKRMLIERRLSKKINYEVLKFSSSEDEEENPLEVEEDQKPPETPQSVKPESENVDVKKADAAQETEVEKKPPANRVVKGLRYKMAPRIPSGPKKA